MNALSGAIFCDRLVWAGHSHMDRQSTADRGVTPFHFLIGLRQIDTQINELYYLAHT